MDTITLIAIAIAVLAVFAIGAVLIANSRKAAAARRIELARHAEDHRAEAEANVAKATEINPQREQAVEAAERHEAEAARHAEQAHEHRQTAADLGRRTELAGRAAGRHDEEAARAEEELGRI